MTASFQTGSQEKIIEEGISDLEFNMEDLHKVSDIQNLDASDMLQIEKFVKYNREQRKVFLQILQKHGIGQAD